MYNQDLVETVIADKFRIVRRIGGGSFGEIYLCVGPNGTEVPKTQTFFALSCCFFLSFTKCHTMSRSFSR
jgi:hypothetical protein